MPPGRSTFGIGYRAYECGRMCRGGELSSQPRWGLHCGGRQRLVEESSPPPAWSILGGWLQHSNRRFILRQSAITVLGWDCFFFGCCCFFESIESPFTPLTPFTSPVFIGCWTPSGDPEVPGAFQSLLCPPDGLLGLAFLSRPGRDWRFDISDLG